MIRIGLYGINGHQVPLLQPDGVRARVVAVGGYPAAKLDETLGAGTPARQAIREYPGLDGLLQDNEVHLISLCSPRRSMQANDALRCLQAGKHVLAEKPSAFTNDEIDLLLATAQAHGVQYREMADSMLEPSVLAIRRLVLAGSLGTVVHVQAHKSYPWYDGRPQDMETDGGLTRQVGIHAMRFIIGATGLRVTSVVGGATGLGNPGAGNIQIAATFACTLGNGAIASINLNYLNPRNFGNWGNDQLRVFGTRGMAESVDGFSRRRLYLEGRDAADLPLLETPVSTNYLLHYVSYLLDGTPMPMTHSDELATQRAMIAAQEAVDSGERVSVKDGV